MGQTADYVVVGSGSAGSIIARRLADSGAQVILLEAGRRDNTQLVRKPGMIAPLLIEPKLKTKVDWGHYTVEQKHALGRKIPQTHGKVLGGSSSINGMVFVRGNHKNFDDWAAEGNTGWSFQDVLPELQEVRVVRGRRQRLARWLRPDQGHPRARPDARIRVVHRRAGRPRPASRRTRTTTARIRKASRSSSRATTTGFASARQSATSTTGRRT